MHVGLVATTCPTLKGKRVTPHVLRHSAAKQLLQNGVDRTVIALWLGHESVESTQMYVHADIQIKEQAMAKTQPVAVPPGRYRPNDELLAFLEGL
jgi:integrase/recombinase XerD